MAYRSPPARQLVGEHANASKMARLDRAANDGCIHWNLRLTLYEAIFFQEAYWVANPWP